MSNEDINAKVGVSESYLEGKSKYFKENLILKSEETLPNKHMKDTPIISQEVNSLIGPMRLIFYRVIRRPSIKEYPDTKKDKEGYWIFLDPVKKKSR